MLYLSMVFTNKATFSGNANPSYIRHTIPATWSRSSASSTVVSPGLGLEGIEEVAGMDEHIGF